ncbi:MAG: exopolyphosphatase [Acidobacteriota bacterium]
MRLVTRGNLDGLTCAVLTTEAEPIDSIELTHPQEITDGRFALREGDIIANLPFQQGCAKWFDHHAATRAYSKPPVDFEGKSGLAPSCARLVYDYYLPQNPDLQRFDELIRETDRFDSADLSLEDITQPKGYILLGFTLDPRSGLGEFREYFLGLVDAVKKQTVGELLESHPVKERVERISREREAFLEVMAAHSRQVGNVIFTDLREAEKVPAGNRFLIYTLFPEANVSFRVSWGPQKKFVVATVGHSIFNRSCPVHVGSLMAHYGGGGHLGAGATPLSLEYADRLIDEILAELQKT